MQQHGFDRCRNRTLIIDQTMEKMKLLASTIDQLCRNADMIPGTDFLQIANMGFNREIAAPLAI